MSLGQNFFLFSVNSNQLNDMYFTIERPADNGLDQEDLPLLFSTSDDDLNGCVPKRGGPGWYGSDSDCDGFGHKMRFCRSVLLTFVSINLGHLLVVDGQGTLYKRCPDGLTLSGQSLNTTVPAHSDRDCARLCSKSADCKAVNVCPVPTSEMVSCSLVNDQITGLCDGLTTASSPSCYSVQKVCQNGGTVFGDMQCACPVQYSGRYCERYIRDCTEAFENGHQSLALNGVYFIQPVNAPRPFLVHCEFAWGGVTFVLRRNVGWLGDLDWASCKEGFGASPSGDPQLREYFAGLENLHYFTAQARYKAHFHMRGSGGVGAFYDNINIGSENTTFALTYGRFIPLGNTGAENGLLSADGLLFSTSDHDPHGCAFQTGAPGWYGTNCTQHSFFAVPLIWPVSGAEVTMSSGDLIMERHNDFY
ncbi:hypothetical protein BaRGS_00029319 [Batillaria attramentaria]|uniref:EGF-like domain-containing protein n=1 Tax=Batillaria attramentaria TaxID=370345 RepID=A0ABD0JXI9_9CAEN